MSKMLGTRCPECGTNDAPCVVAAVPNNAAFAVCPRCGRCTLGEYPTAALAAFYGPQPESGESEELPRCRCGGRADLTHYRERGAWDVGCALVCTDGSFCTAATPEFSTAAEAIACWRRMMEG